MAAWQKWFCVIVMALIGVFCIMGAVCNWNWFFENSRSQLFVNLFGRNGARIAYAVLGIVILVLSILAGIGSLF